MLPITAFNLFLKFKQDKNANITNFMYYGKTQKVTSSGIWYSNYLGKSLVLISPISSCLWKTQLLPPANEVTGGNF